MIPGHIDVQHPANRPYKTQNTYKTGRDVESPQISKTDEAAPTAEMIMHVVTWNLSVSEPMITEPIVAARLTSMTVNADNSVEAPKAMRA